MTHTITSIQYQSESKFKIECHFPQLHHQSPSDSKSIYSIMSFMRFEEEVHKKINLRRTL